MCCCIVETLNLVSIVRLKVFSFFKAKLETLLLLVAAALATHHCKP